MAQPVKSKPALADRVVAALILLAAAILVGAAIQKWIFPLDGLATCMIFSLILADRVGRVLFPND